MDEIMNFQSGGSDMITERILESASSRLTGRTIKDVRIGLELLAVLLDNGQIGVTYVLKGEIEHTCKVFSEAGSLTGLDASEMAVWAVSGKDVISRALGLAVCNAVAKPGQKNQIQKLQDADAALAVNILPGERIGVIGYIGPVIARLRGMENELLIFEKDLGKGGDAYPESSQAELLPDCQLVFITSSTLINGSLEQILTYCKNAREIIMVGSSTPLYPEAFQGTGVTVLSGTLWPPENSDQILAGVSQCAGMKQLIRHGQKISLRVNP